jgi:hypothetical protein
MKVVVLQPSYIPWRGYFHQVQKADLFVFYDCVQYDCDGWRNRNQIRTAQGPLWLTIPVRAKGHTSQGMAIKDVAIDSAKPWRLKHWRTLEQSYAKAPHFKRAAEWLRGFYARTDSYLADFTCDLTVAIARELSITHTRFVRSSTLSLEGTKTDRLLSLLTQLGATHYISGPSARGYMEEDKLAAAGITLEYMHYDYPDYPQLHGPFLPQISIIDLLFNVGPDAPRYIWAHS